MVYPALLPLMRTPRLPVVDWTDDPADLNGLVRFAERLNLVSARVPSHFNWPLPAHRHYYKDCMLIKVLNYFAVRYKPIIQQIYLETRHKFWFQIGGLIYDLSSSTHTMWNVWTMLCQSTSLLRLMNFSLLQYSSALLHSSYCQSSNISRLNVIQQKSCLRNIRQPWDTHTHTHIYIKL